MPSLIETFDVLAAVDNALRSGVATARTSTFTKAKPKPQPRPPRTHAYTRREVDALIDRLEARMRGQ